MIQSQFISILFDDPDDSRGVDELQQPAFFSDLNLDQVAESLTAGREDYNIKPFLYAALHDVDSVRYRQDVFRDLEGEQVRQVIDAFAETMREMRSDLGLSDKLSYVCQKERWFLDAVAVYCKGVQSLSSELSHIALASEGMQLFRRHLSTYIVSAEFTSLVSETHKLLDDLGRVQYSVHLKGNRVQVGPYDGESDYSEEVEQTFLRFKQGAVKDYRVKLRDWMELDTVEERILALVAKLFPDLFGALDEYCARNRDYLDRGIGAFDREVQLYLAYIDYMERFRRLGLAFSYPEVSVSTKDLFVEEAFDLSLADKLQRESTRVVSNDLWLEGPERIIVISGPNNGGKTTFARMFGQLCYLASLGLPVPGAKARLFLPDCIYTHFERVEQVESLRGKLEDELYRIHAILDEATSGSVIVMNESFASTTLDDAVFLGTEVIRRIDELGCLCVYVTFVDELSRLSEATVSMVSTIVPENPAERTFKVVRKTADGLAYAAAIAEKYRLTYRRVKERVAS